MKPEEEHHPLGEVCEVMAGNAWPAKKFNFSQEGLPVIRIQDMTCKDLSASAHWAEDYDDKFVIKNNDILLSLSGSFKIVRWAGRKALLNQRIMKLTPSAKEVDADFFVYQMLQRLSENEAAASSAVIKNTSLTFLRKMKVWICSLTEQQRIVARIKECLGKVDEVEALRAAS